MYCKNDRSDDLISPHFLESLSAKVSQSKATTFPLSSSPARFESKNILFYLEKRSM
jgi:hypothetical protein